MYDYGTTATFLRLTAAGWEPGCAGFTAAAAHHPYLFTGFGPASAPQVLVPQHVTRRLIRLATDTCDPTRPGDEVVVKMVFGDDADVVFDESWDRAEVFADLHEAATIGARTEPGRRPLGEAVAVSADRLLGECGSARQVVGPFLSSLAERRWLAGPASAYEMYQQAFEAAFAAEAFGEELDGLPAMLTAAIVLEWLWPWACLDNPEGLVAPDVALGETSGPVGEMAAQLRDLADEELDDDQAAATLTADLVCRYLDALDGDDPWLVEETVVVARALIDGWQTFGGMVAAGGRHRAAVAAWLPVLDRAWYEIVGDGEGAELLESTAERVSAAAYRAVGWPERAAVPLGSRGLR